MNETIHKSLNVSLRKITKDNFEEVIALRVRDDQHHVASNVESIAQTTVYTDELPFAIYMDETPVGFVQYSFDYDNKRLWINRLMIDQKYQGKGYAIAA